MKRDDDDLYLWWTNEWTNALNFKLLVKVNFEECILLDRF